ncbi:zinc finger BED domain-containing 1-like protein [Xyrichtys novacula]|uniref:Zinc finger BED domain-containing 1-like protein n=1 Tax=Xyrichtys novacula TaxID=13765 RepID=A0AAV1H2Q3_XYRNO|nr:zinc finger BED domain-containing 1-like protein [Xyrichtys novacula]
MGRSRQLTQLRRVRAVSVAPRLHVVGGGILWSRCQHQPKASEADQTGLRFLPKCDRASERHKDITHAVTCSIARDILPITTVEKPGFDQLLATLDPRYEVPGRKYVSNTALQA